MTCSCGEIGCDEIFDADSARLHASSYLKRGLERRDTYLLQAIEQRAPRGYRVLDVGAGVGALAIELLKRNAARAVIFDASTPAIEKSRELAGKAEVADRLDSRNGNFADADVAENFDVVVLNRVICCYPRWRELLEPAAAASQGIVALVYPREKLIPRAFGAALNTFQKLRRRNFRFYVHPLADVHALLRAHGFRVDVVRSDMFWEIAIAQRDLRAANA